MSVRKSLAVLLWLLSAALFVAAVAIWTGPETVAGMFGCCGLSAFALVGGIAAWNGEF